MYIDNNGTFHKDIETIGNHYFANGVRMSQLTKDIAAIRKATDNNYEGMIGYVKNFSWNYTPDGGYDCSVSIISTGEILESLQLRFDPAQRGAVLEDPSTDAGKEQSKSIYHFFISKMATLKDSSIDTTAMQQVLGTIGDSLLSDHIAYFQEVTFDESYLYDKATLMHWIPLRLFFDIFNTLISPVDTTKVKGSSDRTLTRFNTDYAKSSKLLTSPEHFSIDPTVCVLAYPAKFTDGTIIQVNAPQTGTAPVGDLEDVLNIYISLPYLKSVLDGALDEDGKLNKSMHDITETILEGINTALGGINDLGLAYDDEDEGGTWYVVDRNNTPADSSTYPVFTLAGIESVFTDVGISSKISNEIGSQISIAAQGSASSTNEYIENILKWNAGTIDRIKVIKTTVDKVDTTAAADAKKEQKERADKWSLDVKTFFNNFNSFQGYEKDEMEAAKTMHAEWTVANVVTKYRIQTRSALPGLVPVELSFKTDGIGGFIIGQAFKVGAGILPSKYQDRFGYIVTGIEHGIDSKNRWETSVTTQFYPIDKPSDSEVQAAGQPGVTAREAANQELNRSRRTPYATSAKKIASFGKVGNNVPLEAKPILDTIAYTEGTAASTINNGYDLLVGFGKIPDWTENYTKGHPKKAIQIASIGNSSTAAGRYQFLKDTWKGKGDLIFNKANQDLVGWKLVQAKQAAKSSYELAKVQISSNKVDVNSNAGFLTFLNNNYAVWASLVNSRGDSKYSNQSGGLTPADIYRVYIEAVKKYT